MPIEYKIEALEDIIKDLAKIVDDLVHRVVMIITLGYGKMKVLVCIVMDLVGSWLEGRK